MSRFAHLQSLFEKACELPHERRAAFVDQSCANDPELHAELSGLLAADDVVRDHTARKVVGDLQQMLLDGPPDALIGAQVGRYTLVRCIGAGGMGSVYLAERNDGVVQQRVAIKFLGLDLLGAGFRERFEFERETLARLDHPNITRLIDAEQLADGTPYYVMDYVEGLSITRYAFENKLDIEGRLELFVEVAKAVAHAHQALIVHRDIKPGNILVDTQGAPHLLDFGIAKPLAQLGAQSVSMTVTGQRFFSPQHAAPEQLLGGNITVGCDVYGLGCLLYELLTGEPAIPLTGLSTAEAEKQILHQLPQSPSQRVLQGSKGAELAEGFGHSNPKAWSRRIKGELDSIVLTCLRKLAHERYRSVDELIADVQAHLAGMPINRSGGHGWYRARKFVARHRWAVTAALLTSMALISSSVVTALQAREARTQRDRAQQVTQFLIDAFAAANPGGELGKSVTAKDILDHGAKKLDAGLVDQPELKAQLLATIAEAQRALSMVSEAASTADKAAALLDESTETELAVSVLIAQIRALTDDERLNEAEQALASARTASPKSEINTSALARAEIELLMRQGHQIKSIKRSAELLRDMPDTVSGDTLTNWYWVKLRRVQALSRTGSTQEAAVEMSDIALQFDRFPPSEVQLKLKAIRLQSKILADTGDKEGAAITAKSAVELASEVFGEKSLMALSARQTYMHALAILGRNKEASREAEYVLDLSRSLFGATHENVTVAIFNAAYQKSNIGNADEARELFQQAIDRAVLNSPPNSKSLFTYRAYFAEFLAKYNECERALEIARSAEEAFRSADEYAFSAGIPTIRHVQNVLCNHKSSNKELADE